MGLDILKLIYSKDNEEKKIHKKNNQESYLRKE